MRGRGGGLLSPTRVLLAYDAKIRVEKGSCVNEDQ